MRLNLTEQFGTVELVDGVLDNTFKQIVTAGWNDTSSGHVESTSGFFTKISLSKDDLLPDRMGNLVDSVFDDEVSRKLPLPDPGFYITVEFDSGLIWVYKYSDKRDMEAEFKAREKEFNRWNKDVEADV